jgi:predicted CDP-diglyceride synthetase/phosphatidate cytidylyltransferase
VSRTTEGKIVVITTVYPEVEPYLCRYLDSLEAQTSKDFEVLIANDGFIGLVTMANIKRS